MLDMADGYRSDNKTGWEGWRLASDPLSNNECKLHFQNDIQWRIPLKAGDGNTKDECYAHQYQGEVMNNATITFVNNLTLVPPSEGTPNPRWRVWVRPSLFDFEFLDTTARRFSIFYDHNGRPPNHTRPFYLEDLERLNKLWGFLERLKTAQCNQIIYTIESARERWCEPDHPIAFTQDEVFRQFVNDTLAGANWPGNSPWKEIPEDWREKLVDAGVKGELADLAELYMDILKG
jgi:hypothetical protein